MKYFLLVSRLLLGLIFFVFGLNNILHFLHMPFPSGDALAWFGIMAGHGWMTFVGVIMVISGLLLLVGRFVPLALAMLAPVIVNILLYHALLWPHGYVPAIIATVLEIVLLIAYHRSFAPLFVPDAAVDTRKEKFGRRACVLAGVQARSGNEGRKRRKLRAQGETDEC